MNLTFVSRRLWEGLRRLSLSFDRVEHCSDAANNARSITKRSIALELNVITVIRPTCLYGDEAGGDYTGRCGSL